MPGSSAFSVKGNPFVVPGNGPAGPTGPTGAAGANGQGVPVSGASGSVLTKNSATDFDTSWVTRAALAADAAFSALYQSVPTAWTGVSAGVGFVNSWVDFGAPQQVVQYRKIGDLVQIRGACKNGTINTTVFTLPAGFRPPNDLAFATTGVGAFAQINITAAGVVSHVSASNASFWLMCEFSIT